MFLPPGFEEFLILFLEIVDLLFQHRDFHSPDEEGIWECYGVPIVLCSFIIIGSSRQGIRLVLFAW